MSWYSTLIRLPRVAEDSVLGRVTVIELFEGECLDVEKPHCVMPQVQSL